MIKIDRFITITASIVVLLTVAVPVTVLIASPSDDTGTVSKVEYESINIYVYFSEGDPANIVPNDDEPMIGGGSDLATVISSAFGSREGYEISLLPTMAVDTVNGRAADQDRSWIIFQWSPPTGWTPVVPGPMGDSTLVENTSYIIAHSGYSVSSGRVTYDAPPVGGPISECVFYIVCDTVRWGIKASQLGEGEYGESLLRKLNEGMFIVGYGTSAANAFVDACKKAFDWEGPFEEDSSVVLRIPESRTSGLSDIQKYGLKIGTGQGPTIAGWLGIFMGLYDVPLSNGIYEYWTQYSWSDSNYRWGYNGWCLGYYDPAVTKYIGMFYGVGTMQGSGDSNCPFKDIDPHDYVAEV